MGPVDAVFKAIESMTKVPVTLNEYLIHSVTEGIDAQGQVTVKLSRHDYDSDDGLDTDDTVRHPQTGAFSSRVYTGQGASTDILVASAKAYLAAVNRLMGADAPRRRKDSSAFSQ